jgi:DNA primase
MGFERDRLPDPLSYYTDTAGLQFREKRGLWRTAKCPWHGGTSLRINTRSGSWCCMAGCGSGGDVLGFHMALHGLEFVDAARQLGAWVDDPHSAPARQFRPAGLSARDALRLVAHDALLVGIEAARAFQLKQVDEAAKVAVVAACARIGTVARAALGEDGA